MSIDHEKLAEIKKALASTPFGATNTPASQPQPSAPQAAVPFDRSVTPQSTRAWQQPATVQSPVSGTAPPPPEPAPASVGYVPPQAPAFNPGPAANSPWSAQDASQPSSQSAPYSIPKPAPPSKRSAPTMVQRPPPSVPSRVPHPDPLSVSTAIPVATTPVAQQPRAEQSVASITTHVSAGEMLQLLWYDPEVVPRIRRQKQWQRILDEFENEEHDPAVDDVVLDQDATDVEDHRDVFELLTRAKAHTTRNLNNIVLEGIRKGGKYVAPLALFAGTLALSFDHIEALKATITTALPFSTADEALASVLKNASTFLETPNLLSAPEVSRSLIKRINDAFGRTDRMVSRNYLQEQRARALLENRYYQRCEMFGTDHIRALLSPPGDSRNGVPTYLPASLATELPMYERFRVRLIATVEPATSQFDSHAAALRVTALSRLSRRPF